MADSPATPGLKSWQRRERLTRAVKLPSCGWLYGDQLPTGEVVMSALKGEDEEIIAGAGEGPQVLPVLRELTERLVNTGKLPFNQLLFSDWMALTFHFFAFSYGADMSASVRCPHCKRLPQAPYELTLDGLPCYVYEEDADLVAVKESFREPFTTQALPPYGDTVKFRLLRVQDQIDAEAFYRQGMKVGKPGDFVRSYALAKHIVEVNGEEVSTFEALDWVRNATTGVTTRAFKEEISLREPGFSLTVEVNCPWLDCGAPFSLRLPEDGSFFRQSASQSRKFKVSKVQHDESGSGEAELSGLGGHDSVAKG